VLWGISTITPSPALRVETMNQIFPLPHLIHLTVIGWAGVAFPKMLERMMLNIEAVRH
jgi:hypothetical protein